MFCEEKVIVMKEWSWTWTVDDEKNKELISTQRKEYYDANKELISIQTKEYREVNKEYNNNLRMLKLERILNGS